MPRRDAARLAGSDWGPLLVALLAGDEEAVHSSFESVRARRTDLAHIARDLVQPALEQVGAMWRRGEIGIAEEHLATALVARAFHLGTQEVSPPRPGAPRLVLVCPGGEFHDLGARLAAEVGREEGWQVEFLGANLPSAAALEFVWLRQPEVVGLSITLAAHVVSCASLVKEIRRIAPAAKVLAGGLAFRLDPELGPLAGADAILNDAVALRDWLRANRPVARNSPEPSRPRRRARRSRVAP